jgi:signal transduction histidine kinase
VTLVSVAGWPVAAAVAAVSVGELRRRRELIERACHEVRGPLGAARLALASLERGGAADPAGIAGVDLELRRAGLALDDLVAAPRGGRAPALLAPVAVAELLEEQEPVWAALAIASGRSLAVTAAGEGWVLADRLRLAQAVGNLVANAAEHGAGRVTVTAQTGARGVRLEVADEGPGLAAPLADLVRSARGGRGRRGRGLAIAAEIARAHGGRLEAAPSGGGARLVLELPGLEARAAQRAPAARTVAARLLRRVA